MTVLIIIDGKVYRAKKKWPIEIVEEEESWWCDRPGYAIAEMHPSNIKVILKACFDEVASDGLDAIGRLVRLKTFTLRRLTGRR